MEAVRENDQKLFCLSWEAKLYSLNTTSFGELIAGAGTVETLQGFTTGISAVWGVWGQALLGCVIFVIFVSEILLSRRKKKERCLLQ